MAIQQSINNLLGTAQIGAGIGKMIAQDAGAKEKEAEQRDYANYLSAEANKAAEQERSKEERMNRANISQSLSLELNPLLEEEKKRRLELQNDSEVTYKLGNLSPRDGKFKEYLVTRGQRDQALEAYKKAAKNLEDYQNNPTTKVMKMYASGEISDFASYKEAMYKTYQEEANKKLAELENVQKLTGGFYVPSSAEMDDMGSLERAQQMNIGFNELYAKEQARQDALAEEADAKENK